MSRLYKKSQLAFSLTLIAVYVVLFSVSDRCSALLGIEKIITAPIGILFAVALLIWIKKQKLSEEYGLRRFQGNKKHYLFFIPLLLIMSCNLWNGVALNIPVFDTVLYIVSMLCVGVIEEIIFRGFLFKAISKDNLKLAIFISSITFGIGHIVNLLSGADILSTVLQVCYATAIGFLFTVIFYKGKSLLPCIVTHGIFNALGVFAVAGSQTFIIIRSVVLCVVSVGYALWLLKKEKRPVLLGKNEEGQTL